MFQRIVSVVFVIAILLGSVPQQEVRAASLNQTSAACVIFVVTGPAAGALVPTCILTWEGAFWVATITAVVAGVSYTAYANVPPSSSQQVRIGGGTVMVTVPEAPAPQPVPPASTPIPVVPQQTPAPTPRPTAPSSLYTEVRTDGTVACKGGPNPSVYTEAGWKWSDCAKAGMPWPGPSVAVTPVPAPAPLPEATPGGFEKLVNKEEQVRADITATARAQEEEERRNRRCPPLPGVSQVYTAHIAEGHTQAEWQDAINHLNAGARVMYLNAGGTAYGAYQSFTANANGEYGWQFWSWDTRAGRWALNSTYPRANRGWPFANGGPSVPPAAGCRPVTAR